nr:Retrovirus-related Pol polyprotein from transposon 17.6 [Ipomoea batatas]
MNSLEAKVEKATKRMNEAMLRELEVHEPFPCFDGSDPRGWIIKCLRFFRIYSGFTEHQKVVYATQHFEGKAEVWIQQLMKENLEWRGFVKAILCRFDNGDLFEDFRNLRQTSTVRKYTEEFEALCGLVIFVLEEEGSIDKYLMQCFISGLRAEFRATLRECSTPLIFWKPSGLPNFMRPTYRTTGLSQNPIPINLPQNDLGTFLWIGWINLCCEKEPKATGAVPEAVEAEQRMLAFGRRVGKERRFLKNTSLNSFGLEVIANLGLFRAREDEDDERAELARAMARRKAIIIL